MIGVCRYSRTNLNQPEPTGKTFEDLPPHVQEEITGETFTYIHQFLYSLVSPQQSVPLQKYADNRENRNHLRFTGEVIHACERLQQDRQSSIADTSEFEEALMDDELLNDIRHAIALAKQCQAKINELISARDQLGDLLEERGKRIGASEFPHELLEPVKETARRLEAERYFARPDNTQIGPNAAYTIQTYDLIDEAVTQLVHEHYKSEEPQQEELLATIAALSQAVEEMLASVDSAANLLGIEVERFVLTIPGDGWPDNTIGW